MLLFRKKIAVGSEELREGCIKRIREEEDRIESEWVVGKHR